MTSPDSDDTPQNAPALFGADDAPVAPSPARPYKVLARKYRPKNFDELIGQDVMVRILTNAFAMGRVHQAYMLTGVRGVGKTTTARILARALNYEIPDRAGAPGVHAPTVVMPQLGVHCQAIIDSRHVDVIEMDAASHTGVDDVREIIEGARYKPAVARMKVYIIDEVHMLSKSAFNALLKTLEEPPEHVKFIFATTEIEKVPVTVRSRCLRFDLRRVETPVLVDHLAGICAKEGVAIARDALGLIARAAEGSVRDSLSLLDQAIAQGGGAAGVEIPADDVRAMLGLADKTRIVALFEAAMSGKIADAIALLQAQYDEGADPAQVLLEVAEFTHLVTRVKIAPDAPLNAPTREEAEAARANAQTLSIPLLNRAWQILSKGVNETRESARPLAAADMALVRLAYAADLPSPDEALRKLGFGAGGAPVASPRAPAPRGGGANAQAHYAAATAFAPAPDSAPRAFFKNFADVVAKAGAERDIQLKTALERDVRLVRFEQGQIEFSLRPGGSAQLAQTLMRKLQDWTGERWMVALSSRAGAPSIMEGIEARAREKETGVKSHPLVRAALEAFPGAEIIAVRMADDEDAAAGPDVAFDDAVLSPIEDDEPDF